MGLSSARKRSASPVGVWLIAVSNLDKSNRRSFYYENLTIREGRWLQLVRSSQPFSLRIGVWSINGLNPHVRSEVAESMFWPIAAKTRWLIRHLPARAGAGGGWRRR